MAGFFAELTMAVHFVVLVYIVFGAFLAWRWPKALLVHLPFALWGLGIATLNLPCPLTILENHLRGQPGHTDGFIAEYVDGVLYPDSYLLESRLVAAALVVVAYAGALIRYYRRKSASTQAP